MNSVIVDNSNTRTKFALISNGKVVEQRVIKTADVVEESVKELLRGWSFERVCICSVVPHAAKQIAMACHDDVVVEFLTPFMPLQVDFSGYEGIQTLGADRVANALAAAQYRIFPVIAVDMGTATTFDVVVEREGRLLFSGGVIAPGLAAFSACLNGRTALLPVISSAEEQGSVIGSTTQEAMAAAVRVGYPALVDGILDGIEKELGEPAHVVLTGGDAALIGPRLRRKCIMEPMLTLNGIARAFRTHL